MSAPNFSCSSNAKYIYAFCEHRDFEAYIDENKENFGLETEEDLENAKYSDSCLYDDWYTEEKAYYLDWLEQEINQATAGRTDLYTDFTESHKIYDGDEIASICKYFNFAGAEFMVMASINFEAGYYEGFALDWNIKKIEGPDYGSPYFEDELPDADGCFDLLESNTDLNAGLCRALAPKLEARIEQALDEITTIMEQALQKISPYHLTGVCACNGEGFYTNHKES